MSSPDSLPPLPQPSFRNSALFIESVPTLELRPAILWSRQWQDSTVMTPVFVATLPWDLTLVPPIMTV